MILRAALSLAPSHHDVETDAERFARQEVIAEAIVNAANRVAWPGDKREIAFLLLATGHFESRYALHVHAGKCRKHECDGGRAATPWQIQRGSWLPKGAWEQMQGTDLASTKLAALWAARFLTRGRRHCRSTMGAIALYATGRSCNWGKAPSRFKFTRHLLSHYGTSLDKVSQKAVTLRRGGFPRWQIYRSRALVAEVRRRSGQDRLGRRHRTGVRSTIPS